LFVSTLILQLCVVLLPFRQCRKTVQLSWGKFWVRSSAERNVKNPRTRSYTSATIVWSRQRAPLVREKCLCFSFAWTVVTLSFILA